MSNSEQQVNVEFVEGETEEQEKKPRKRRVVDKDTFLTFLLDFKKWHDDEVERNKNSKSSKSTGVKFNKSIAKKINGLIKDYKRVLKQKPKSVRKNNKKSGFNKPVKVSKELCEFLGIPEDELISRIDVTSKLCAYVKKHKLYDEADKRFIVPNEELAKLLKYEDPYKHGVLTYFSMQKYMTIHYPPKVVKKVEKTEE